MPNSGPFTILDAGGALVVAVIEDGGVFTVVDANRRKLRSFTTFKGAENFALLSARGRSRPIARARGEDDPLSALRAAFIRRHFAKE